MTSDPSPRLESSPRLGPSSRLDPLAAAAEDGRNAEARRRERHLHLSAAAQRAFADPAFRRDLDDLKARCARARRPRNPRPDDITFDMTRERHEGWVLEPIGNVFA